MSSSTCSHSDAGYLNENKARSRESARIWLSEDFHVTAFNDVVLAITQIFKHVMSSAADVELGSLCVTARKIVEL